MFSLGFDLVVMAMTGMKIGMKQECLLESTSNPSTILCVSFVSFLISLLVSFLSLSVIIYQQEEGIYLDHIVYSSIAQLAFRDR